MNQQDVTSTDDFDEASAKKVITVQLARRRSSRHPPLHKVHCVLFESEIIKCFLLDGEIWMCLPQIRRTLLKHVPTDEISAVCYLILRVSLMDCDTDQLKLLQQSGAVARDETTCTLIRGVDATRLCEFLLQSGPFMPVKPYMPYLIVSHSCFGGAAGHYISEFDVESRSRCIHCSRCYVLFSPPQFVCHSHIEKFQPADLFIDPVKYGQYIQVMDWTCADEKLLFEHRQKIYEVVIVVSHAKSLYNIYTSTVSTDASSANASWNTSDFSNLLIPKFSFSQSFYLSSFLAQNTGTSTTHLRSLDVQRKLNAWSHMIAAPKLSSAFSVPNMHSLKSFLLSLRVKLAGASNVAGESMLEIFMKTATHYYITFLTKSGQIQNLINRRIASANGTRVLQSNSDSPSDSTSSNAVPSTTLTRPDSTSLNRLTGTSELSSYLSKSAKTLPGPSLVSTIKPVTSATAVSEITTHKSRSVSNLRILGVTSRPTIVSPTISDSLPGKGTTFSTVKGSSSCNFRSTFPIISVSTTTVPNTLARSGSALWDQTPASHVSDSPIPSISTSSVSIVVTTVSSHSTTSQSKILLNYLTKKLKSSTANSGLCVASSRIDTALLKQTTAETRFTSDASNTFDFCSSSATQTSGISTISSDGASKRCILPSRIVWKLSNPPATAKGANPVSSIVSTAFPNAITVSSQTIGGATASVQLLDTVSSSNILIPERSIAVSNANIIPPTRTTAKKLFSADSSRSATETSGISTISSDDASKRCILPSRIVWKLANSPATAKGTNPVSSIVSTAFPNAITVSSQTTSVSTAGVQLLTVSSSNIHIPERTIVVSDGNISPPNPTTVNTSCMHGVPSTRTSVSTTVISIAMMTSGSTSSNKLVDISSILACPVNSLATSASGLAIRSVVSANFLNPVTSVLKLTTTEQRPTAKKPMLNTLTAIPMISATCSNTPSGFEDISTANLNPTSIAITATTESNFYAASSSALKESQSRSSAPSTASDVIPEFSTIFPSHSSTPPNKSYAASEIFASPVNSLATSPSALAVRSVVSATFSNPITSVLKITTAEPRPTADEPMLKILSSSTVPETSTALSSSTITLSNQSTATSRVHRDPYNPLTTLQFTPLDLSNKFAPPSICMSMPSFFVSQSKLPTTVSEGFPVQHTPVTISMIYTTCSNARSAMESTSTTVPKTPATETGVFAALPQLPNAIPSCSSTSTSLPTATPELRTTLPSSSSTSTSLPTATPELCTTLPSSNSTSSNLLAASPHTTSSNRISTSPCVSPSLPSSSTALTSGEGVSTLLEKQPLQYSDLVVEADSTSDSPSYTAETHVTGGGRRLRKRKTVEYAEIPYRRKLRKRPGARN